MTTEDAFDVGGGISPDVTYTVGGMLRLDNQQNVLYGHRMHIRVQD